MIDWHDDVSIYLHREPVDFRKAINGLSVIVEDEMGMSPFDKALYVFCNKRRSQLKVLYWDNTGFVLWQKRLEKDKFKWPRRWRKELIELTHEQWSWLLRGFDLQRMTSHNPLSFSAIV